MVKNWLPVQETQEMWVQSPGQGRSLGEGNGNPVQYSCLKNSMDRGALWGRKELDTTEHAHI